METLKSSGSCFTALIKKQIHSCGFRSADLWLFWVYCVLCLTASCTGLNFFLHIVFCCVILYVVALQEQEIHRVWWLPEGLRLPFHYRKQCWQELKMILREKNLGQTLVIFDFGSTLKPTLSLLPVLLNPAVSLLLSTRGKPAKMSIRKPKPDWFLSPCSFLTFNRRINSKQTKEGNSTTFSTCTYIF